MGRHEESIAFIERSRRLNPVSPVAQFQVAMNLYLARRYEDAIRKLQPRSISLPASVLPTSSSAACMWRKVCPIVQSGNWSVPAP